MDLMSAHEAKNNIGSAQAQDDPVCENESVTFVDDSSTGPVLKRLAELEATERIVSATRRRLHERIDFLAAEKFGVFRLRRLERLDQEEKKLSLRRRQLHAEIDAIRSAAGLPSYRDEVRKRLRATTSDIELHPTCIMVEMVNGTLRCFDFQDENLAAHWYEKCCDDWHAERPIVISTRPGGPSLRSEPYTFPAKGVLRIEITTRQVASDLGVKIISANIRLGSGSQLQDSSFRHVESLGER